MAKKQPYTTTPTKLNEVLNQWPPIGGQPIQVGPQENWYNLAIKYGFSNPFDLIDFNFKTKKPSEVNWYLHFHLGCNLVTKDGANYRFGKQNGTAVEPVTLYIPQRDWTPDGGPASPVQRPPMDEDNMQLAVRVRNVLADGRLQAINFSISGRGIGGGLFSNVRRLVESGAIAVYRKDSDEKGAAEYDDGTNSFHVRWVGSKRPLSWECAVVHEAVHAGLDYEKCRDIYILDSEAAAYIAQSWYKILRTGFNGERITGDVIGDATDNIHSAAYNIAASLHTNRMFEYDDLYNLRFAITQHPNYGNWKNWCTYDGVSE